MSGIVSLHRKKRVAESRNSSTVHSGPLLATKLVPPRASPQQIPRARLEGLLAEVSERLLTVIRAPGGFGKTTLALAWIEALKARGDRVAWLSLDADDDEPRRFVHHAIRSVRMACASVGAEALRAGASAPLPAVQAMLVNEIADCGDDLFLFLDDYQSITQPAVHEIVAFLLRHAPANLRFVVLSRSEPPLGLPSLRARGMLLEIDAARLRFTRDETREFLQLTSGAALSPPDVRNVHGLTEGWPAALRITSLSFGAGRDPAELLRSLTGSSRSIGGFLDELLGLQTPDTLAFMEQTSIVDRLSAPLCEALTGHDDSADRLEQLTRQQMIDPLGNDGSVFACHQLLREHLLQRLERRHAAGVPELHRRAAAWYESHGMMAESVKHWLAGGDTTAALARIADCADAMVQSGDVLTLLGWEQQLRNKLIQAPLELQLSVAWARTLSLSREEGTHYIAAAERFVSDASGAQAETVRRECIALRTVTAGLADDHARVLEFGSRYVPAADERPFSRDAVNNALRFAYVKTARWPEFYSVAPVTPPSADARAGLMTAIYEAFTRGVAEFSQGRAGAAEQHYLRCISMGAQVRGFTGAMTLAAGPYAELLYETGRTDAAAALLRDEADQLVGGASVDTVLRAAVTAAHLAARRGHIDAAQDLLERAEAVGLTHDWPRLVAGVLFERLWLHLRSRRSASALGLLKRLEQLDTSPTAAGTRALADAPHYRCMAQLLVGIDQNRPNAAIRDAEALFADAIACGANLLALRVGSLLACAHLSARSVAQALRVFHKVLDIAEPDGLIGSIADAGPEIATLIGHVAADTPQGAAGAARRALLERLRTASAAAWDGTAAAASATRTHELRALLTPRECEILDLIAEGQSNKAIARQLSLGPETVKSHLKNVFAKLGVERRTQAVLRAAELGLVRPRVRM